MARLLAYVVCFIVMQALPLEKKTRKDLKILTWKNMGFTEFRYKNSLKFKEFKVGCFELFWYVYTIN